MTWQRRWLENGHQPIGGGRGWLEIYIYRVAGRRSKEGLVYVSLSFFSILEIECFLLLFLNSLFLYFFILSIFSILLLPIISLLILFNLYFCKFVCLVEMQRHRLCFFTHLMSLPFVSFVSFFLLFFLSPWLFLIFVTFPFFWTISVLRKSV